MGLLVTTTSRVSPCFLLRDATLLRWLGERHICTKYAKNATSIDSAFESTQCAIDRLVISNFNSYGH